ncbi:uncharacterized protein BBA_00031 [Beauveria bassiana ARSEF 2860]|uniref:Uncharacterized protein n=1 Tax=Beauveria bassiana (strain ARSEF 2860) TaxID=655819 RepID=J5K8G7_BEAB2|nr:uncharacterized protein BBA_00031 [Beauveria bassiana ARSEF 2860]EJP70401.1 hypothetical protein BBA_00031 [Beauveria bassiana ARSEF 2860]
MPRGAYDCTGAAPGSYASRQARQMYPCGGGSTPRASQAVLFTGPVPVAGYQSQSSHVYGAPPPHHAPNNRGVMNYGFPATGIPTQAGFVPQQQQQQQHQQQQHVAAYMTRPGCFAPSSHHQPQQQQMQMVGQRYAYPPPAAAQLQSHQGIVYSAPRAGGYPQQQQQQQQQQQGLIAYGATGFAPAVPTWYRRP